MMQATAAVCAVRAGSWRLCVASLQGARGPRTLLPLLALISAEVKQMGQNASITHSGWGSDRPSLQFFTQKERKRLKKHEK